MVFKLRHNWGYSTITHTGVYLKLARERAHTISQKNSISAPNNKNSAASLWLWPSSAVFASCSSLSAAFKCPAHDLSAQKQPPGAEQIKGDDSSSSQKDAAEEEEAAVAAPSPNRCRFAAAEFSSSCAKTKNV